MHDLDLIPADYRQLLQLQRWLIRLGLSALLIVGVASDSRVALAVGIRSQEQAVEQLRAAEALSLDRRARLATLRSQREELGSRLGVLEGLRGGAPARQMLLAVDRAFGPDLWLLEWDFRRAGELVEKQPETEHAGYFVVVPASAEDERPRAWRLDTHMEMRGRALHHAALAGFVRRLVEQPEILDVRILNTQARQYTSRQVVDFDLAVVVRSHGS